MTNCQYDKLSIFQGLHTIFVCPTSGQPCGPLSNLILKDVSSQRRLLDAFLRVQKDSQKESLKLKIVVISYGGTRQRIIPPGLASYLNMTAGVNVKYGFSNSSAIVLPPVPGQIRGFHIR